MRGNLYPKTLAKHCVRVLIAFTTFVFSLCNLKFSDISCYNVRMLVNASKCGLFPLPQSMLDSIYFIKRQDLVAETQLSPILALLAVRCAGRSIGTMEEVVVWFHYEYLSIVI